MPRAGGARLIIVNPTVLVAGLAGGTVTVTGNGFPAGTAVAVWLDINGNGALDEDERLTLSNASGTLPTVTTDGSGAFTQDFQFSADVSAGAYQILAGPCSSPDCSGTTGTSAAPVTVAMGISHSKIGGGSTVTVSGVGFPASSPINIWYDTDPNGALTSGSTSVSVSSNAAGAFSTPMVINGAPSIDALFAAISGHAGVAAAGPFFVHASASTTPQRTVAIDIGSCWFNECLIYDAQSQAHDTVCLFGNSPQDNFTYFADCKEVDVNYTHSGYDFSNVGPTFAGAGALAAMINDLQPAPPGSACAAMTGAIAAAEHGYGNQVPDKVSLLAIACGGPPPMDLGLYVTGVALSGHDVPDKGLLFAAVAAINAAAPAVAAILATASATTLAAGSLFAAASGAATNAAAATGVDPVTAAGLGATVGATMTGAVAAGAATAGTAAVIAVPALISAAQVALAEAAVAGALACGFVNYWCNGSDITANLLGNAVLQTEPIPVPFVQPPFKPAPIPNPCAGITGNCWGGVIGWSQAVCTSQVANSCETPTGGGPVLIPTPGSAGSNNGAAPIRCVTGKVQGLSIGYDGDISFSVNDDPGSSSVLALTNYHNFLPGPGGTDAPGGIDVEIPLINPLGDPALQLSPSFHSTLASIHQGTEVAVCGHWVADMHMYWNELHPMTSLSLAPDFTLGVAPSDLSMQYGETASVTLTVGLLSGPSEATTLSVLSGLPAGASPSPASVTPAAGSPATSTLNLSGVPLGDTVVVVQARSPEGVTRTTSFSLHVYDYGISLSPLAHTVLRGGSTTYLVSASLLPGSSGTEVPSITFTTHGGPGDAVATFAPASVVPGTSPAISTLSLASAAAGSLGDFALAVVGTNPSGTTRTSGTSALHLYDFSVAATPPLLQVLTTGSNAYQVAVALAAGSSSQGLPSITLSDTGLPIHTAGAFNPMSGLASGFASVLGIHTANAPVSAGVPVTIRGTDARSPEGGSRSVGVVLAVLTPAQALGQLVGVVGTLGLNSGQTNSLTVKIEHAIDSLNTRPADQPTACNQLHALVNEVNAYVRGGQLTAAQAALLLGGPLGIDAIEAAIPCP